MTPAQIQAIAEMNITQDTAMTLMQELGLSKAPHLMEVSNLRKAILRLAGNSRKVHCRSAEQARRRQVRTVQVPHPATGE